MEPHMVVMPLISPLSVRMGQIDNQRCVAIGLIAPVERWMCIEALQAAHD
jgi:hypothetical protein